MSNRKAIFFTSDWHIGHKKSIEFDERPFKDIDHMHRVLINNYNACVLKSGVCYFLGDHEMCGSDTMVKIMRQLNGTKVLIIGNHDKGVNTIYNIGFGVVLHGAKMLIASRPVTLSHCPLLGIPREDTSNMRGSDGTENWHGENRRKHSLLTFPDMGENYYHLHGHIHSRKNKPVSKHYDLKQFDVTANDYRPVSISQIESWIAKCEQEKQK